MARRRRELPTADDLQMMKDRGMSDSEIAKRYGASKTAIRVWRTSLGIRGLGPKSKAQSLSVAERTARREQLMPRVVALYEEGLSFREIGRRLGISDSTARCWLQAEFKTTSNDLDDHLQMVYDFVTAYKYRNNGNSPTRQQIADGTNFSHTSVWKYLGLLARQGRINIESGKAGRITVVGGQWIPPTGWKMPARLRQAEKVRKPRKQRRMALAREGRLCDCGQEAHWWFGVALGQPSGHAKRVEKIILCHDCADLERENGTELYRIEETP